MNAPAPSPVAGPASSRQYSLRVVQQPVRARMCGFGDKDRRPISPPIIVRLTAADAATGRVVGLEDMDAAFLVLAADLRGPNGLDDANVVRQDKRSASLAPRMPELNGSSTVSTRSPSQLPYSQSWSPSPPPRAIGPPGMEHKMSVSRMLSSEDEQERTARTEGFPHQASGLPAIPPSPSESPPAQPLPLCPKRPSPSTSPPSVAKRRRPSPPSSASFIPYVRSTRPAYPSPSHLSSKNSSSSEDDEADAALVPNLIGTLHTNAHKLRNLDGEMGIYFVLPDLSVRTEGAFRLRLRLVDLRQILQDAVSPPSAAILTDEFQVFTAKRFEGMLGPTSLSQCFAKQGIRIPTRRASKWKKAGETDSKVKQED